MGTTRTHQPEAKSVASWCVSPSGQRAGLFVRRDLDGRMLERGFFDDQGRQEGPWRTYHPNGRIHTEMAWRAGKRHGEWHRYSDTAVRIEKATWRDDLIQGVQLVWDSEGRPLEEIRWYDSQQHGINRRYHPNRQVAEEWTMRLGQQDGPSTSWDPTGQVRGTGAWRNGLKWGTFVTFDEAGRIESETPWVSGKRQGEVTERHANGAVATRQTWVDDQPVGPTHRFSPAGEPLGLRQFAAVHPYSGGLAPTRPADPAVRWALEAPGPAGKPVINGHVAMWPVGATVLAVDLVEGVVHRAVNVGQPPLAESGRAWEGGAAFTLPDGATAEIGVTEWWHTQPGPEAPWAHAAAPTAVDPRWTIPLPDGALHSEASGRLWRERAGGAP